MLDQPRLEGESLSGPALVGEEASLDPGLVRSLALDAMILSLASEGHLFFNE